MGKALAKIYYDASGAGSFGGVERLYQRALAANVAGVTRDIPRRPTGVHIAQASASPLQAQSDLCEWNRPPMAGRPGGHACDR